MACIYLFNCERNLKRKVLICHQIYTLFWSCFNQASNMGDSILLGQDALRNITISPEEQDTHFAISVMAIVINIVSGILTVIINAIILTIHIQNRKSPSRVLIASLAVTDLLTGMVVQPMFIVHVILDLCGKFNDTVFLVFNFFGYVVCGVSLVTAGGMSVDRLFASVAPFWYKIHGKPKIFIGVVAFIWFQGICFCSLFVAGVIDNKLAQLAFGLTVGFAVVTFIVSYIIIMFKMRMQERRVMQRGPLAHNTVTNQSNKQRKNTTKTFALLIMMLCLMYLPMFVIKYLLWKAKPSQIYALLIVNRVANTVTFLNSLSNPLLYCYFNLSIRRRVKEILTNYLRGNRVQPIAIEVRRKRGFRSLTSSS